MKYLFILQCNLSYSQEASNYEFILIYNALPLSLPSLPYLGLLLFSSLWKINVAINLICKERINLIS